MMTDTDKPRFQIGDIVYVAWASSHTQKQVPCPVCFGKRHVTVILGNGEHQPIECDYCGLGYDGPRGVVNVWSPFGGIRCDTITGISLENGEWEYRCGVSTCVNTEHIFGSQADAEECAERLLADATQHAAHTNEQIMNHGKKKLSWSVGYHRNQIKDLQRQIDFHRKRLVDCDGEPVRNAVEIARRKEELR